MKRIIDYLVDHLYCITEWDWVAIIVSLTSLGIAITSMIIATKTLKSQRETEKNTKPIMGLPTQSLLLDEVLVKMFDGFMRLTSLKHLYDKEQYKMYLSEEKLMDIKIDPAVFHVELFYSNEDHYRIMQGFLDRIIEFNSRIDVCINHFKNPKITQDFLKNEILRLIEKELEIVFVWDKAMTLVYGYDVNKKRELLDNAQKKMEAVSFSEKVLDKYYDTNSIFSLFYDTKEQKERLVSVMNRYTASVILDFSSLLIERY